MARIPQVMRPEDHPDSNVDQEALRRAFERYADYHDHGSQLVGVDVYGDLDRERGGPPMSPTWAMTMHDPEFAWRLIHLSDYIVNEMEWGKRTIPRELMIFVISKHMKSEYAFRIHYPIALAVGVTPEQIAGLDYWEESDLYDDEERLVIEYTTAALTTGVSDELFERARALYGDRGMMELSFSLSYWVFWSLNVNMLRPQVPTKSLKVATTAVAASTKV